MNGVFARGSAMWIALIAVVAGCSPTPQPDASNVQWNVAKNPKGKGYRIVGKANLAKGIEGFYQPTITMVDDRGCRNRIDLPLVSISDKASGGMMEARFDEAIDVKRRVATAEFVITYVTLVDGALSQLDVYSGQGTLDATIHPPADPVNPCDNPRSSVGVSHPTRDQLRERAKTDPDGADAQAISQMPRNQLVATAINTAGFLCARVTDLYPDSDGKMIAHCVEYRSGRGRVKYRIDAEAGSVEQME